MIELYKKNVWRDAKTVNAIALACLRKETKVIIIISFQFNARQHEQQIFSTKNNKSIYLVYIVYIIH